MHYVASMSSMGHEMVMIKHSPGNMHIQLSAVISQSNKVWYYKNDSINCGRISMAGSTKDILYLTIMGELWSVFCEYFLENWQRYNGTTQYVVVLCFVVTVLSDLGWGLLKLHLLISPLAKYSIWQKYMFDSSNHIHIWQVSLQLTCGDSCQI